MYLCFNFCDFKVLKRPDYSYSRKKHAKCLKKRDLNQNQKN